MTKRTIVGVDYGTTTTQISFLTDSGIPDLADIGQGQGYEKYLIRSIIGIDLDKNQSVVVGDQAVDRPNRVILPSLKRCLLCSYDKTTGRGECTNPPNQKLCSGLGQYTVGDRTYKVGKLIELFFKEIRDSLKSSESGNGLAIESAETRVSVPSLYRGKTIEVLSNAVGQGLRVSIRREVNHEPTSALATLFSQGYLSDGLHVVCDIGGGTTDVAMIHKTAKHVFLLEPDSLMVGGNDLDQALFEHVRPRLIGKDYSDARLMQQCRLAKERLSKDERTRIANLDLSQRDFERLIGPNIEKIASFLHTYIEHQVAALSTLASSEVDRIQIHLAGGGSKVPLIERRLQKLRFDGLQIWVAGVRGNGTSEVYGEDFPTFCIALGNVLDFDNFNLSSLPVTIKIQRAKKLEQEFPSHTDFPIRFAVE